MTQKRKQLTLCIPCREDAVLLGLKKRGFGAGRWNGFGGKLEHDESIEDGARRELREEIFVDVPPADLEKRGVTTFEYRHTNEIIDVHIFRISNFAHEAKETDEMRPRWFTIDEIPYREMWPDDQYWLPLFLEGKTFFGHFVFSDFDTIIDYILDVRDM